MVKTFCEPFRIPPKRKNIALFFVLISSALCTCAQDDTLSQPAFIKYFDIEYEYGNIIGNGSEGSNEILKEPGYNGLDIRIGFRKNKKNDTYSNLYRNPYMGIGWFTSDFSNLDVGNPNALYLFMTSPFSYNQERRLTFAYSAAFGLAFNFFPYDSINNQNNIFIGSKVNCYVNIKFLAKYQLSNNLAVKASVGFKHASNGAFKTPNAGLNLIPVNLGISYKMNPEKPVISKAILPGYIPHNLCNVKFSAGSKNYNKGASNYYKATIGVNFLRQISYKYRLGFGIETFYAQPHYIIRGHKKRWYDKRWSLAATGSWEWVLSERLYIPIDLGVYLFKHKLNKEEYWYYERIGIRYRIHPHIFAGITIKAHRTAADFIEWTIGYTFHKDPNKFTY